MPAPASCSFSGPIPKPATTHTSCAVPLGNDNSTIIDTCCNGHINVIQTFGGPDAKDDCYLFCTTDSVDDVKSCLNEKLGPYDEDHQTFQCFDGVAGKAAESGVAKLRLGKGVIMMICFGFLGAVMGI